MQTILGAGGAIGTELARILPQYTDKIRLVSRKPVKVNAGDELFAADLTHPRQTDKAVEGSDVVYLVAGIEYKTKIWENNWPVIMQNVINACRTHHARLVFFDNVYMYDSQHLYHMTEETPVNPSSRKGAVRAYIAKMLMDETEKGELTALIARSADFIGPKSSILVEMVYNNMIKDKKAMWFSDAGKVHTFTFIPDAAKATALLGNSSETWNQVWHLPTDQTPLTGQQWITLFAGEMDVVADYNIIKTWQMGALGLFVPVLRELKEMAYQYDRDYLFDSSKFETKFQFKPTKPGEAVRQTIKALQGSL